MTNSWTPERSAVQAERCRAQKPWTQSTGPRTKAGKKRASKNALRHGEDRTMPANAKKAIKLHRAFMQLAFPIMLDPEWIATLAEVRNELKDNASKNNLMQEDEIFR